MLRTPDFVELSTSTKQCRRRITHLRSRDGAEHKFGGAVAGGVVDDIGRDGRPEIRLAYERRRVGLLER